MADERAAPLLAADVSSPRRSRKGFLHDVTVLFAVGVWIGSVMLVGFVLLFMIVRLACCGIYDVLGLTLLSIWVVLSIIPLRTPRWAKAFTVWASSLSQEYFPIEVKLEDPDAWKLGGPYVVGFEPHSAMPIAMPPVFFTGSPMLPKQLEPCHMFASSVCFVTPIVRHLYHWLGIRPISRHTVSATLNEGCSVVLVPGGVREILHMAHGKEVAFLRKRTGFVQLALRHGAPLVAAFGFGQTEAYHWYKPGLPCFPQFLINSMSRSMGFVPLVLWGRWGTPIPLPRKMTVVVSRPILVPKVEEPSAEQVQYYLRRYIEDLQRIFEAHRSAAGYPELTLEVL